MPGQGDSIMAIDWSRVLKNHIKEACRRYDAEENRPTHPARTTFLILDGEQYPAKFIRGLAYEIATGHKLSSDDYSGGAETARFFEKLGYSVEHGGKIPKDIHTEPPIRPTASDTQKQKHALKNILKQLFGQVDTEATFDWLVVPDQSSMNDVLSGMHEALVAFRGYENFSTPGRKLQCDFFIPSENLIIEYDERQHFTEPRAISFDFYPENISFGFDTGYWKNECNRIKAKDPDKKKPDRDEQRAFYDSVRDILAARNGMTLIRIKHEDYDWESESGVRTMDNLINNPTTKVHTSNIDEIDVDETIEQMACDLAKCQEAYCSWAKGCTSHEKVIEWLKKNNIGECQEQSQFDLLHSHWNSITIPTLRKLVPDCMARMKDGFDKLFQNRSKDQIVSDPIWYLIYFLHPVRHELYYFKVHYPDGYSPRLAKLVRSHRLGLKSARTYLSKKDREIGGSHISACGTVAFKHLHLHPTTSTSRKTNLRDLKKEDKKIIRNLEMGDGDLSSDELKIAVALSTRATLSFERWINYAQCAINEGPIFTLKEGKKHSDCCKEIIKNLESKDQKQDTPRDILEKYYKIKVTSKLGIIGHEYNHFMNLRIGGTPPYPPPPDNRSELDYLNEFIPDTYWFCYAFMTPAEFDAFRNMAIQIHYNMLPHVLETFEDLVLVHVPRGLDKLLDLEQRIEVKGETGWFVKGFNMPRLRCATQQDGCDAATDTT